MSNTTSIHFHYKGAQVHCESDCGAPDTKSAVEAVDQALTAAGLATFNREPVVGSTSMAPRTGETHAASEADDSQPKSNPREDAAEEEAKAKAEAKKKADADAKKKADADAKAKKAADKKAADDKAAAKKKADEDAAEKAAQEEQASEEAGDSDASEDPGGDEKPEITLEKLRDQVMAYAKENGNVQGKRLVQEVGGAEKISNVPEEKWLALYKAAGGEV